MQTETAAVLGHMRERECRNNNIVDPTTELPPFIQGNGSFYTRLWVPLYRVMVPFVQGNVSLCTG